MVLLWCEVVRSMLQSNTRCVCYFVLSSRYWRAMGSGLPFIRDDVNLAQLVRVQDCQSRGWQFDSGQNPTIKISNLHAFELHRTSNKGTNLLFQVIKAIIKQEQTKKHGPGVHLNLSLLGAWSDLTLAHCAISLAIPTWWSSILLRVTVAFSEATERLCRDPGAGGSSTIRVALFSGAEVHWTSIPQRYEGSLAETRPRVALGSSPVLCHSGLSSQCICHNPTAL